MEEICAAQQRSRSAKSRADFGGGFLLSEKAAAEKAAAEKAAAHVWELSDREWEIVRQLPRKEAE